MRCLILLTATLLVFTVFATNKKTHSRHTRHHHKQVENLNMIRRGPVERAPKVENKDHVLILGADGKLHYGSLKDELANKCKANLQKEYQLCAQLNDCDYCSASSFCGISDY